MALLGELNRLRYIALPLLFLGLLLAPGTASAAKVQETGYSCEWYTIPGAAAMVSDSSRLLRTLDEEIAAQESAAQKRVRCQVYAQGPGLRSVAYQTDDGQWKNLSFRKTTRRNLFQSFRPLEGSRLQANVFQGSKLLLRSVRQGERICSLAVRGQGFRLHAGGNQSELSSRQGGRLEVEAPDGRLCELRGRGRAAIGKPLVEKTQAPTGNWSGQERMLRAGPYFRGSRQKGGSYSAELPETSASKIRVRFQSNSGSSYRALYLQSEDPDLPPIRDRSWAGWESVPPNPINRQGAFTWQWFKSSWTGANDSQYYTCWLRRPGGTWNSSGCDYAGSHSANIWSDGLVDFKVVFSKSNNNDCCRFKESPVYTFRIDTEPPTPGFISALPDTSASLSYNVSWNRGYDSWGLGSAFIRARRTPYSNGSCSSWDDSLFYFAPYVPGRSNTIGDWEWDDGEPGTNFTFTSTWASNNTALCVQYQVQNTDRAGSNSFSFADTIKIDTTGPVDGSTTLQRPWYDLGGNPVFANPTNSGSGTVWFPYPTDPESGIIAKGLQAWRSGTGFMDSGFASSDGVAPASCSTASYLTLDYASSNTVLRYGDGGTLGSLPTGCYRWRNYGENGVGTTKYSDYTEWVRVDQSDPSGGALAAPQNSTNGSFTVSIAGEYKDFQSGRAHQFLQRKVGVANESGQCSGGTWTRVAWPAGGSLSVSGAQDGSCYTYRYVARNLTFPGTSTTDPSGTESTVDGQSWTERTVFVDSSPPETAPPPEHPLRSSTGSFDLVTDRGWPADYDSGIQERGVERQRKSFLDGEPSGDWQPDGSWVVSGEPEAISQNVPGPYCYRYRLYSVNGAGLTGYTPWSYSIYGDAVCVDTTPPADGGIEPTPLRGDKWAGASTNLQVDLYKDPDSGVANILSERFTPTITNGTGSGYGSWSDISIISLDNGSISRSTSAQGCYEYRLQGTNGVNVTRAVTKEICRDTSAAAGGSLSAPERSSSGSLEIEVEPFIDPESGIAWQRIERRYAPYNNSCPAAGSSLWGNWEETAYRSGAALAQSGLETGCWQWRLRAENGAGLVATSDTVQTLVATFASLAQDTAQTDPTASRPIRFRLQGESRLDSSTVGPEDFAISGARLQRIRPVGLPATSNLLGAWPLDGSARSARDFSGRGNDLLNASPEVVGRAQPEVLYAWGDNASGQLGDGGYVQRTSPVQVTENSDWSALASGGAHSLGIVGGKLYGWGINNKGQVGDGTLSTRAAPQQIGTLTDWEDVSAADSQSHAIRNGILYGWGNGSHYVVGDGTTTLRSAPVPVGSGTNWQAVATGDVHALGIRDGQLWGWGRNDASGGRGSSSGATSGASYTPEPTRLGDFSDWTAVAAGGSSSYAIRDSQLYSWGQNEYGQLGDGTKTAKRYPVRVGSLSGWQSVDAGADHALAIRDGRLYAWGRNNGGQLGDGTLTDSSEPVQIGVWTDWQEIEAGSGYSMGLRDGKLYVWGANNKGQLGTGATTQQTSPVRLGTADDWRIIAAGDNHSLATQEIRSRQGGSAWNFAGSGTSVDTANQVAVQSSSIPSSLTSASVAGWVRPGTQPNASWTALWNLGGNLASANRIFSVWQRNTDNAIMIQSRTSGSSGPTECYGPSLPRYTWSHIAAVRDSAAGQLRIYLNGELAASCSVPVGSSTVSSGQNIFRVGSSEEADGTAPYSFRGQMSDLALWNKALSAGEAEQAFASPSAYEILVDPTGTGPVSVQASTEFQIRDTSGARLALQPSEDRTVEFTGSLPRLEMGEEAVFTDSWSALAGAAPQVEGYTGNVRIHLRTRGAEMRLQSTSGLTQALGYSGWTSGTEELVFEGSPADANDALAELEVRAGVSAEPRFLAQVGTGSPGTSSGQLNYPASMAVDSRGNIYITDTYNHRIQKFNSSGDWIATLGGTASGSTNTTFNLPHGIDIDTNDNIYVADYNNNRIQKYSSNLAYLATIGSQGSANGQLLRPYDVAVASSGNIYVTDAGNNRVQKFNAAGSWLATRGGSGTGPGQWNSPSGLDLDGAENVYVADSGNNRIQKLNSSLQPQETWGGIAAGAGPGQWNTPSDLAVSKDGSLWVVDRANHRLQELDRDGRFLMQFASRGSDDGELLNPFGATIDPSGNLWIGDQHNHRVQKFALDKRRNLPGSSPQIDAWATRAGAAYNPDTDTYYQLAPSSNWLEAEGYSTPWNGMEPYSVTVGSRSELEFIERSVTSGTFWMGGGDGVREGRWIWTGGPEAGTAFWNGQSGGTPVDQGSAPGLLAAGGNAQTVWVDGTWHGVHSFRLGSNTPTYFLPERDMRADYLIVGGGGGGGGVVGGGGGAGGLLEGKMRLRAGEEYPIKIGRGGPGGVGYNNNPQRGEPGQDTRALGLRAFGGGGGSAYGDADTRGATGGGSGGGGARAGGGGEGTLGQGFAGGTSSDGYWGGSGGGGAAATGASGGSAQFCIYSCSTIGSGGGGGAGITSSISGSLQSYAGGGGGGSRNGFIGGIGGTGGGGSGTTSSLLATAGTAGTGGGGGGAGYSDTNSTAVLGGAGGSGLVVIRYPLPTGAAYAPWAAGEPNNWGTGEDCAQIYAYTSSSKRFNDGDCASSFDAVREYGGWSDEAPIEEASGTTTLLYQQPPSSAEGELWTWGAAASGGTGNGQTSPDVTLPQRIGSDSDWDQVEAAHSNGFAIRNGQLWGWGLNSSYQLGLGDTTQRTVPTRIGTASDWEMISMGSSSVAGIRSGQLWTWGSNANCQTAQSSCSGSTTVPTRVGTESDWTWVSVGRGSMAAIRQGQLWTVGSNLDYGTAQGTNSGSTTSLARVGTSSDWTRVSLGGTAGSPGNAAGAGIRGGQLWTWGSNLYGQTAQGTASGTTPTPAQVGAGTAWEDGWTDVNLSSSSVGAGIRDGQLWTWGSNTSYGTGQGTNTGNSTTPQRIGTASDWREATVGWSAGLALRENGTLWSWGSNAVGTTGQGSTDGATRNLVQVGSEESWIALPNGSPRAVAALRGPSGTKPIDASEASGAINVTWETAPASPTSSSADLVYTLAFSWRSTGQPANIAAAVENGDFLNEGSAAGCSFSVSTLSPSSLTLTVSECSEGTVVPVLGTRGAGGEIKSLQANGKTYQVHTFRTSDQLRLPRALPVEYLLVGGGGGGGSALSGNWEAGGGGGGGVLEGRRSVQPGTYSVVVGSGGASSSSGSSSSWSGITALGGGAGGSSASGNGSAGGSGGGSGWGGTTGGAGSPGQGFAGERGGDGASRTDVCCSGGGGGGAGEPGGTDYYGAGGDGIISSITGSPTWYGGGGGAHYNDGTSRGRGSGGAGGGGESGFASTGEASAGERGQDGTGGGGGGSFRISSSGGAGGSGIVVLRYPVRDYRDARGPEVLIDRSEPSVRSWIRTSPQESPSNVYQIEYEITFSEPIQGLQAADFSLGADTGEGSGAWSVSSLSGSGSGPYLLVASGAVRGVRIQPSLPAGSFQDLAGIPSSRQFTGPETEINSTGSGQQLQSEAAFWLRADALGLEDGERVSSWQSASSDLRFAEAHPDRWPRWSDSLVPRLWVDASNRDFVGTVGGAVASVKDNSSLGNDVSQGLASARPSLAYWGNRQVLSFDGNDYLDDSKGSYPGNITIVAVAKEKSPSSGYERILNGGVASDARMFFGASNGSFAAFSGNGNWNDTSANTPSRTFTEPAILSSVVSGSSVSSFINGTAQNTKTGPYTASGFTGVRLGAISDSDGSSAAVQPTSQFFSGELGEILVFPSALAGAERQIIEAYLARKWGLSLETNNPYTTNGYEWCAPQGGTCAWEGGESRTIVYGRSVPNASGESTTGWVEKTVRSPATCSGAGDGDPSPSYSKPCFFVTGSLSPAPRLATQWGSLGSGAGNLQSPTGIATDKSGNVWVADTANHRIQKFSSSGTRLMQIGTGVAGSSQSQLASPRDVAIDTAGNIYIADSGNSRIQKFDSSGNFLASYGSQGSGTTQLLTPSSVAVDSGGNIYIADSGNDRLLRWSPSGGFLQQWGSTGSGSGQLQTPYGLALDDDGSLWVAEAGNRRIQKFAPDGRSIMKIGSQGSGDSRFGAPRDVALDDGGNLYVLDGENNQVQQFNPDGVFLTKFAAGQLSAPMGIAVGSGSSVYISDSGNNRVAAFDSTRQPVYVDGAIGGKPAVRFDGNDGLLAGGYFGEPFTALAVARSSAQTSQSLLSGGPGCALLMGVSATGFYESNVGGPAAGCWSSPSGSNSPQRSIASSSIIAMSSDGRTLRPYWNGQAQDTRTGGMTEFSGMTVGGALSGSEFTGDVAEIIYFNNVLSNKERQYLEGYLAHKYGLVSSLPEDHPYKQTPPEDSGKTEIPWTPDMISNGDGSSALAGWWRPEELGDDRVWNGRFSYSQDGDFSPDGSLFYVPDRENNRIQVFDRQGKFVRDWGRGGSGPGEFDWPWDVAVAPSGRVLVVDGNNRVQVFDPDGEYLFEIGQAGSDDVRPSSVAVSAGGQIYITDNINDRVDVYTSQGDPIRSFRPEGMGSPYGIEIDEDNQIWIADSETCRVRKYSQEGRILQTLETRCEGAGLRDVALGKRGIYVGYSDRVEVWDPSGRLRGSFSGSGPNSIGGSHGIALIGDDEVWVSDSGNHRLLRFNSEGKFLQSIGGLASLRFEGKLASWPDASGKGRDLSTTNVLPPTIARKALNGYNVATFDGMTNGGSGQNLQTAFSVGWPYSLYYVGRLSGEKNGRLLASANSNANWLLGYHSGKEDQFYPETWVKSDGPAATTNWNTYGVVAGQRLASASSRWMQLRKNGRALAYASGSYTDANAPRGISLGNWLGGEASSGQVAEVVLVGAGLSEENRQRLEGYLAWKYDQQSTLPEGHPYRDKPPTVTIGIDLGEGEGGPRIESFNSTPPVLTTRENKLDFRLRLSNKLAADPERSDFRIDQLPPDWEVSAVEPGSSDYKDIVGSLDPREYWTLESGGGFTNQSGSASLTPLSGALAGSAPALYKSSFGGPGNGDGQLSGSDGVAIDEQDNVYLVDSANDRVQKFDARGRYLTGWGSAGSGPGQFQNPSGIVVDVAGNVYVSDQAANKIQKFSSNGTLLASWGSTGSGSGQFSSPRGLATDGAGNVYVADSGNHRIQKFDSSGAYLARWGSLGSSNGALNTPVDLDIDKSGNIYVLDQANSRVQKFTSAGAYLARWGSAGSGNGQFSSPQSLLLDRLQNVYVVDSGNSRMQKFTSSGSYLSKWGSSGSGTGQFSSPKGAALNSSGDLFVVDSGNSRLQVWGPASPLRGGVAGSTGLNLGTSGQYLGTSYTPPAPVLPGVAASGTATTSSLRIDGKAYVLHRFTGSGSLQARRDTRADYLLVGGGGGGGGVISGGGGGGGVLAGQFTLQSGQNYPVEVGSGGTGGLGWSQFGMRGNPGGDTTLFGFRALGGGGGAGWGCCGDTRPATAGGSGGGGSGSLRQGAPGTRGQGFAGGSGSPGTSQWQEDLGGGGGGAGSRGGNASISAAGRGGDGRESSISGVLSYYGGGGGGGARAGFGAAGAGGLGGGGAGVATDTKAADGAAGTGGGGGGGAVLSTSAQTGGSGGSGVAMIRYPSEGKSSSYLGWARTSSEAAQTLLGTSAPDGSNWRLRRESDGTSVSFRAGSTTYTWSSAWPRSGGWVQWALVLDASLAKVFFYSNGILRGEQSLDPATWPTNPGTVQLGTRASGTESWQGEMAHFAIYDKAFSPEEMIGTYEEAFDLRRGLAGREYIVSIRRNTLEPAERWIRLGAVARRWRGSNGVLGPAAQITSQGGIQSNTEPLAGQSNLVLYDTLAPRASWQLVSPSASATTTRASTVVYNLQLEDLAEISDISVDDIALELLPYEGAPLPGESTLQCAAKELLLDGQAAPDSLPAGGGTLQLRITGCTGDGTLRPILLAGSIRDQAENWGPSSDVAGQEVRIDQARPSANWIGPEEE